VLAISLSVLAAAPAAAAYTQNIELERKLSRSDATSLALFPAKGYRDGVVGFFRTHGLYVVPDSQRAWCTDKSHGVLKPGCYVELFIQGEGLRPRDQRKQPCGYLARWYRPLDSNSYVPTPGPFISNAIADGEWNKVERAIYDEPVVRRLPARSCGLTETEAGHPLLP
jgi:hypothetical protein